MVAADPNPDKSREAARILFDDPETKSKLYEPVGPIECAAAVVELSRLFTESPGTYRVMLRRSRNFAGLLSSDRLQGLSEIVQNADDVKATEVTIRLQGHDLTAIHDGTSALLRNIHALAAPWLTTKADDEDVTGRFGIGLSTLHALTDSFAFHSDHYHVRLGSPTLAAIDALAIPTTKTVLALQLRPGEIAAGDLLQWADNWDDASLLFLRNVRSITFDDHGERRTLHLSERRAPAAHRVIAGRTLLVRRTTASAPDGRRWTIERADPPSPPGLQRAYKATGKTTSIAVALPHQTTLGHGVIAARLPLADLDAPAFLHAEFDPTVGRQALTDNAWNRSVAALVAELWTQAVVDKFAADPKAAWHAVPTDDPAPDSPQDFVQILQRRLTHDANARVGRSVRMPVDEFLVPLADLAVEDSALAGLLTDAEIADLAGVKHTLPVRARDHQHRWRRVLSAWATLDISTPLPVTPATALRLAGTVSDTVRATAIVTAAIRTGAHERLNEVAWVQLDDHRRIPPPAHGALPILTTDPANLALALGIGAQVAYESTTPALLFEWLRSHSTLGSELSDHAVLEHLSRLGGRADAVPVRLADQDLARLRAALEETSPAERTRLGPGIGQAILLDAIRYNADGSQSHLIGTPARAYLPFAIDKDTDSFASAARQAPGPTWIHPRYLDILRSPQGREGFGARAMLTALGASTLPTFEPHPAREDRYGSRRGLSAYALGNPSTRAKALSEVSARYSLDDQHSPDLDAVLDDIARDDKPERRRRRAHALLTTLVRLWPQLTGHVHVQAANGYYAYRTVGSRIPSWWLARIQDVAWLDDQAGVPRRPVELRQPTQTNRAAYGENATLFVHADLNQPRFEELLHELGVPGEPPTQDFVDRLQALRQEPAVDDDTHRIAASIYAAIATRLQRGNASRRTLSVNASQLRQQFAANSLLLTAKGWRAPSETLRSDPVFGKYRAFVPGVSGMDALWNTLRVPEPTIADCLEVLREIAKNDPAQLEDETVRLEVFRLLNRLLTTPPHGDQIATLRRTPLRTTRGWFRSRPVYAIDDPAIVAGIGQQLPMWIPGGQLAQFEQLLDPFRIVRLPEPLLSASALSDHHENEDVTAHYRTAAEHLRDDLARNEPQLHGQLRVSWDDLVAYRVLVTPALAVDITMPGADPTNVRVEVPAYIDQAAGALRLRTADDLEDPDGAGRAIASLFGDEPRRLTYAWLAAVHAARKRPVVAATTRTAAELATEHSSKGPGTTVEVPNPLEKLQADGQARRSRRSTIAPLLPVPTPSVSTASTSPARVLVNPSSLELVDDAGEIVQAAPTTTRRTSSPSATPPTPRATGAPPEQHSTPRGYTEIDKENLGKQMLEWVLASDSGEILDLRSQRSVGADAIDSLKRYYELKVSARDEPDSVRLEGSERRTALAAGDDFFLVVVSGLEGANATPTVRIIDRPLEQLTLSERTVIEYSGIRRAHSLVFRTRPKTPPSDGVVPQSDEVSGA